MRQWGGLVFGRRAALPALSLAALLVLLAVIPVLVAQSSRRPPPGLQEATRALIEGRYDEVSALTEKLDPQDPQVAAVKARALIARGRYQEAESELRPIAQRAPTSEAALELGLLLQMLGKSDAAATLSRVAAVVGRANDRRRARSRGPRAARHRKLSGRECGVPRRGFTRAARRGDQHRMGRAVPREVSEGRGAEVVPGGAQGGSEIRARAARCGARARRRQPAPGGGHREAGPRDQSVRCGRPHFSGRRGGRRGHARRSTRAARRRRSRSTRRASRRCRSSRHSTTSRTRTPTSTLRSRRRSRWPPRYGEIYRTAGDLAARNYRFDEAVTLTRRAIALEPGKARSLAALGVHLLRTGDEPGAREVLEAAFKIDGFDVVTYNLLQMMDTLDGFVTMHRGRHRAAHAQGRGAGAAGLRAGARAAGAHHDGESGTRSRRRARSSSRCSRSTTTSR